MEYFIVMSLCVGAISGWSILLLCVSVRLYFEIPFFLSLWQLGVQQGSTNWLFFQFYCSNKGRKSKMNNLNDSSTVYKNLFINLLDIPVMFFIACSIIDS